MKVVILIVYFTVLLKRLIYIQETDIHTSQGP